MSLRWARAASRRASAAAAAPDASSASACCSVSRSCCSADGCGARLALSSSSESLTTNGCGSTPGRLPRAPLGHVTSEGGRQVPDGRRRPAANATCTADGLEGMYGWPKNRANPGFAFGGQAPRSGFAAPSGTVGGRHRLHTHSLEETRFSATTPANKTHRPLHTLHSAHALSAP